MEAYDKITQQANETMKILFVASEVAPFAQTGGLADVMGALPKFLVQKGIDARVILPLYRCVREKFGPELQFVRWSMIRMGWRSLYSGLFRLERDGVTYYFIDNEYYFGHEEIYKDYAFDIERFCFFQRAVLEVIGLPMDFSPDILHCNDWQTGLIPCLIDAHYRPYGYLEKLKTVFTIHNLRYQGIHGLERIADFCDLPNSYLTEYGVLKDGVPNMMKAGIVYADEVTTVSPSYAQEIFNDYYGEGLEGVLRSFSHKIHGILNGIDVEHYNPETDPELPQNYSVKTAKSGKAACKEAVQRELGFDVSKRPLLSMITRLVEQKGLDLFLHIAEELMSQDIQMVVLGTGEYHYEEALRRLEARYPDRFRACIFFDRALSNRLYAASDLFLMPSLFEPCGLSQMIAMRYGSIPIVRETGGLRDSVIPYNQYTGEGTGFSFANINAHELLFTTNRALEIYRSEDPKIWEHLVQTAMSEDFSWTRSAEAYIQRYHDLIG
ncbi:MAG: glycogen synthase GlgA [Eubacteriales bacterium]|nr:glycogen synthase GlgA [Eubacteriales bacterium]